MRIDGSRRIISLMIHVVITKRRELDWSALLDQNVKSALPKINVSGKPMQRYTQSMEVKVFQASSKLLMKFTIGGRSVVESR